MRAISTQMLPAPLRGERGDGRAETKPAGDRLTFLLRRLVSAARTFGYARIDRSYFFPFTPTFPSAPFPNLPDAPFFLSLLPPSSLVLTSTS